jgi:hypothetical protein
MIQAEKKWLFARAAERGYTEKEVMPCVVRKVTRDVWVIDVDHPAYPAIKKGKPGIGPGSQLSHMLSRLRIKALEGCSCKARSKKMDQWGPDGCEEHLDEIVGWLHEEARKRKLLFLRWPAKTLVRVAIHKARKAQNAILEDIND